MEATTIHQKPRIDVPRRPIRTLPDRIRLVLAFETSGLLLMTPLFSWVSGEPAFPSTASLIVALALVAALWNGIYSTVFDWLEGRLTGRGADDRPAALRAVQAILLEVGITLISLPAILWWTDLGLWEAVSADLGLGASYAGYAFLFNIAYDRLFPLSQTRA